MHSRIHDKVNIRSVQVDFRYIDVFQTKSCILQRMLQIVRLFIEFIIYKIVFY